MPGHSSLGAWFPEGSRIAERKSERLVLRCSPGELEWMKAAAWERGLSVSDFVRVSVRAFSLKPRSVLGVNASFREKHLQQRGGGDDDLFDVQALGSGA